MLSNEDYVEYLKEIGNVENRMANSYQRCLECVEDEALKQVFETLVSEEKEHLLIVHKIMMVMDSAEK